MKAWMSLPIDYQTMKRPHWGEVSTAAMCPSLTREMKEDNVAWFEVDVIRKMDVPLLKEDWEENRRKTIFYSTPSDMSVYK